MLDQFQQLQQWQQALLEMFEANWHHGGFDMILRPAGETQMCIPMAHGHCQPLLAGSIECAGCKFKASHSASQANMNTSRAFAICSPAIGDGSPTGPLEKTPQVGAWG